jgi:WD40 repeat protein/tRNA A-37 threonylcarbamoyl transferase component Bud32
MTEEAREISSKGAQVNEIIAAYLKAVDAGQDPSRQDLLARYPDLAADLQAFFADHDELDQLAGQIKPAPAATPLPSALSGKLTAARLGDPTLAPGETLAAPGTRVRYFGDYELLEEIARGGMGVVFKARQVSLGRIVALKMILAGQLASEADVRRFKTEAEAAANLDHPHIVPLYDVGEYEGQHYFSMKLIEGGNLGDLQANLSGGRQPPEQAARLVATVARAVHHAHQRGMLHRDLKPANILIDAQGQPHVTDFGLVKRVRSEPGVSAPVTHSGAIVGTPSYMAPEQAAGNKTLTTSVDIYSLGAILYELLTGRPPFRAETPLDTLMQVLEKEPPRPRQVNPQVNRDLETICLKCLDKDPQRRYGTAEALAEDLERWLGGEPIQARPTSRWERTIKWAQRRPAVSALVGVSGTSAVCLLVLGGFLWHNAEVRAEAVQDLEQARKEQKAAKQEAAVQEKRAADKRAEVDRLGAIAQQERTRAQQAQDTARHTLYDADMLMAHAAWQNDSVPGLFGLLERHRPGPGKESDLRGFEWNYLWRLGHQEKYTLQPYPAKAPIPNKVRASGPGPAPALLAVSPDGKTLATASESEPLKIWDLATGKERRPLAAPTGDAVAALTFAPDGKRLWVVTVKSRGKQPGFFGQPEDLKSIWSGKLKPTLKPLQDVLVSETIPLDGSPAAATPLDPARLKTPVSVFAVGPTGPALLIHAMIPMPGQRLVSPMALAASPDGKVLAIAGLVTYAPGPMNPELKQVGAVMLWDVAGNQEKGLLLGHSGPVIAVAFSSDGKTLASASFDKSIKLWDVAAARERTTLRGHTAPVFSFAFSDDGKRLASGAVDGIVKIWDPAASHLELSCKGHVLPVISLAWTPDSKTLLSGSMDGQVKVWDLAAVQGPPSVQGFSSVVSALAFTPDSAAVAGVDQRGTLLVSDVATGAPRLRHKLKVQFGLGSCAALSPDAKLVATGGPMPEVDVFDVAGGQKLRSLPGHAGVVYALAFAPLGQILAVGTGQSQKSGDIRLWNPHTGKELATLGGYGSHVLTLAWSADGKRLAGGAGDAMVKVWDVATAKELVSFKAAGEKKGGNSPPQAWYEESGSLKALAFSPDGRLLAVSRGSTITLREASTGKVRVTIQGYGHRFDSLAFSPDGRRLASGGGAGALGRAGGFKLWDTTTGLEVLTLGDPSDAISCVAFSPDGGRLAASPVLGTVIPLMNQSSGQITLWDGRPVAAK